MKQLPSLFRLFGICLLGLACGEESNSDLAQFNAETDLFEVEVGALLSTETVEIELHSSTGQVIIGSASLSPSAGPVGTEHVLVVEVKDTWQLQVEEVILEVDSGDRGIESFTLNRDSADPGYHQISILSVGEPDETRTDTFTIQLYANSTVPLTDTGNQ